MNTYRMLNEQGTSINEIDNTDFELLIDVLGTKEKKENITQLEDFIKHI